MNSKINNFLTAIGVIGLFSALNIALIVNPVLGYVSEWYPNLSYNTITLLSTFGSLVMIPATIISGKLAGTKCSYRALGFWGCMIIAIAGAVPYICHNFVIVLLTRCLVGIGTGLLQPLGNVACLAFFDKKSAATVQGIGNFWANISGLGFQTFSLLLVVKGVQYIWLIHLLMIIPAVLMLLFLKEPHNLTAQETQNGMPNEVKPSKEVYIFCLIIGVFFMCTFPVLLNISAIVLNENIGDNITISIINAMYTVGGMCAGLSYGKMVHKFDDNIVLISIAAWLGGQLICSFAANAVLMMAGFFMLGMGVFYMLPGAIQYFANNYDSRALAQSSGILNACFTLGGFLTTSYCAAVSMLIPAASFRTPIRLGFIIMAILAVYIIVKIRKKAE